MREDYPDGHKEIKSSAFDVFNPTLRRIKTIPHIEDIKASQHIFQGEGCTNYATDPEVAPPRDHVLRTASVTLILTPREKVSLSLSLIITDPSHACSQDPSISSFRYKTNLPRGATTCFSIDLAIMAYLDSAGLIPPRSTDLNLHSSI